MNREFAVSGGNEPPFVLSMTACSGYPVRDGDCVADIDWEAVLVCDIACDADELCEGVCVGVDAALANWDGVWLGVEWTLGDCDADELCDGVTEAVGLHDGVTEGVCEGVGERDAVRVELRVRDEV